MEQTLGKRMYRGLLKTLARVWNPGDIQDPAIQQKVLAHMQAADRGFRRADAARDKAGLAAFAGILGSLKVSSLDQVDNLKTLPGDLLVALESESSPGQGMNDQRCLISSSVLWRKAVAVKPVPLDRILHPGTKAKTKQRPVVANLSHADTHSCAFHQNAESGSRPASVTTVSFIVKARTPLAQGSLSLSSSLHEVPLQRRM